jgi:DNA-binding LacI/PurR family transcriptional regulator
VKKNARPTIYDLSLLMGVSPGTISRAFNANRNNRINPATRERILRKAREIGYFPNEGARAIIRGKTNRWGLLLPNLFNPRYVELTNHLDLEARKRSTILLLGLAREDIETEEHLVTQWASGEVDGIIADASVHSQVFESLRKRAFPLVYLFGRKSPDFDVVGVDMADNFELLMERMIAAGHRRIGYIGVAFPDRRIMPCYRGYSKILGVHSLPLDESLIHFGKHDYTAGEEAWLRWRNLAHRPTAVLCFNDLIACNLIDKVRREGLQVPDDLSVTGCDDVGAAATYGLTTIRADPAEIAREVFVLLEGRHETPGLVRDVKSTIVDRGSIGPVSPPAPSPRRRRK